MKINGILEKNNKRIDYIDIAKGIGILLMIIGHMPLKNEYIYNLIYSFHMPLFFLISGFFFKHREKRECIKNIIKRLVIPYIVTCLAIIIYKIFRLILDKNFTEIQNTIKMWGIASLYGSGRRTDFNIKAIGAIWFLLALGFATYFMNYIYNKKYRYIWVFIIAYVGYKTSKYIWLPLSIQAGMTSLIFIYLGVLAKENSILCRKNPIELYIVLILIVAFCVKYGGKLYLVENIYNNGMLDIIGALSGTYLCIRLSYFIHKYLKVSKAFLKYIGKNSLLCLCIHLFSLDCLYWRTIDAKLASIGFSNEILRIIAINVLWVVAVVFVIQTIKKYINDRRDIVNE